MRNKYTKDERKAIAKILTAAKKYLWDGKGKKPDHMKTCICFAITATIRGNLTQPGHLLAKQIISHRLCNEVIVENWLRRVAKVPYHQIKPKNVQPYRHRWVDSLIKEFSR